LPCAVLSLFEGIWMSPQVAQNDRWVRDLDILRKGHNWVTQFETRVRGIEEAVAKKQEILDGLKGLFPASESDRLELIVRRDGALKNHKNVDLIPAGEVAAPRKFRYAFADDIRAEVLEASQRARSLNETSWVDPEVRESRIEVQRLDETFTLEGPYSEVFSVLQKLEVGAFFAQISRIEAQGFTSQDESGSGAQVRLCISSPIFLTQGK